VATAEAVGPKDDGERPTLEGIHGVLGVMHAQPLSFEVNRAIYMPSGCQCVIEEPFPCNLNRFPASEIQNSARKWEGTR
jgi:hypothetical protein